MAFLKVLSAVLLLTILSKAPILAAPPKPAGEKSSSAAADVASAPELDAKVPEDFVEHKSAAENVSLKTPKTWKDGKTNSSSVKLNLLADVPSCSVNLVIVPADPAPPLDEACDAIPKEMAKSINGFKLIKNDLVKLNHQPAVRIVYESTVKPGFVVRMCQFFVFKNKKNYIITYTAIDKMYDKCLPTAEQVAVSLNTGDPF